MHIGSPRRSDEWLRVLVCKALVLFIGLTLFACKEQKPPPRIENGVLDLRGWDFVNDGMIRLQGNVEFYWDKWLSPGETVSQGQQLVPYPGSWTKLGYPKDGRASYRLWILTDKAEDLGIAGLWPEDSMRVYWQSEFIAEGPLDSNRRVSIHNDKPLRLDISEADSERARELLLQASNASFYLSGPIAGGYIGRYEDALAMNQWRHFFCVAIVGALLLMGFYQLGIAVFKRNKVSSLSLGLLCLVAALMPAMTITPVSSSWVFAVERFNFRVYNAAFIAAIGLAWVFFADIYRQYVPRYLLLVSLLISILLLGLTFSQPMAVYLIVSLIAQGFALLSFLYLGTISFLQGRRVDGYHFLNTLGFILVIFFAVLESLAHNGFIDVLFPFANFGILLFVICQSLILSIQFDRAFLAVEKSERRISELNQNLKEEEKARTAFFHNTSHELRTPLNGMIGFLELLNSGHFGVLNERVRQQIQKVQNLAVSLKLQVNTILDLAKVRRGVLPLKIRRFSASELEAEIRLLAEGLSLRYKHTPYSIDFDFQRGQEINHDFGKLITIARNLLGNAFKFAASDRKNEVSLRVELGEDEAITLVCSDRGIGIAADQKDVIFKEFRQVDGDARRAYEGTGLGLSMVAAIVDMMQGSISLESQPGQGSCFRVYLPKLQHSDNVLEFDQGTEDFDRVIPLDNVSPNQSSSPEASMMVNESINYIGDRSASDFLILIIDDLELNCQVVQEILSQHGYQTMIAHSGREGLKRMQNEYPDLVLLDLMMPEFSGEDVLQAMRQNPKLESIPVILLTARASEEDRIHGLELGADDYLAKPLISRELVLRVHHLLHRVESTRILESLAQRERMALMGELLSDLSHELKNINASSDFDNKLLKSKLEQALRLIFNKPEQAVEFAHLILAPQQTHQQSVAAAEALRRPLNKEQRLANKSLIFYLSLLPADSQQLQRYYQQISELDDQRRTGLEALLHLCFYLNSLGRSVSRSNELIGSVLNYGRQQSVVHKAETNLGQILEQTLIFLGPRFHKLGIHCAYDRHDLDLTVMAKASDIQQILLNLLSNAADALQLAGIAKGSTIQVGLVKEDSRVRLLVTNRGSRIKPEDLQRVFERNFSTKGSGGSGIGLYVSQRLALQNHGELTAESNDQETTFALTLRPVA